MRSMPNQHALISETLDLTGFTGPRVFQQVYGVFNVGLGAFPRAVQVAKAFQEFRINRLTWKFIPLYDTYVQEAGTSGPTLPHFYYVIDKSESLQVNGINQAVLQEAGAKPIRFDDKILTVSYKPGVAIAVDDTVNNVPQMPKISPWLSTNGNVNDPTEEWAPSAIDHKGLWYGVFASIIGNNATYSVQVTADIEFKKPAYSAVVGTDSVPADMTGLKKTVNL